jgi:glycosyltransferase involved in cell wall biosynthesis
MSEKKGSPRKPVVLIICNYYLPGYKRGGGLRTIVNMVERFNDRFDFRIITRDHDGDKISYDSIKVDEWNEVQGAQVFYLPQNKVTLSKLSELVSEVEPDSIYLNSIFSTLTIFLLTLRKVRRIPKVNIIIAPEGELSDGALQLKAGKKKAFIKFAKVTGLYRNIMWKTTAKLEEQEARRFEERGGKFFVAPNIPSRQLLTNYENTKPEKKIGEVKMIFLSRFMRKKNFKWLVENLENIRGKLTIDIIGPIEDEDYWNETEPLLLNLPPNVKVEYKGLLEYEKVMPKLAEYHFFILPTLGENFGHVFIEALAAGCPLIISDRTPWLNLQEKQIGWDIPLENPIEWQKTLNFCINLDELNYSKLSSNSRKFALQWLENPEIEEDTLTVLQNSLESALN